MSNDITKRAKVLGVKKTDKKQVALTAVRAADGAYDLADEILLQLKVIQDAMKILGEERSAEFRNAGTAIAKAKMALAKLSSRQRSVYNDHKYERY